MRLSVLDLSPVSSGSTAANALASSIDLAKQVEGFGYMRYWLAEHHNAAGIASSSPEIMIATIAAATSRIRVGSGGIMLPNHSSLRVAETFRVLHALHPKRIDLGLGRAPGTDKKTALALRRSPELLGADGFSAQLDELCAWLTTDPDPHVPFGPMKAVPTGIPAPELWLLGSGDDGARMAAERGFGFAFAHHFAPAGAVAAMRGYREAFRPSRFRQKPESILAVSVVCGEDDAHAARLSSSGELGWVRFGQGLRDLPLPSVSEALAYAYHPDEEIIRAMRRANHISAGPERVAEKLRELADATQADEIMITSHIHDHTERVRSYERIAKALL